MLKNPNTKANRATMGQHGNGRPIFKGPADQPAGIPIQLPPINLMSDSQLVAIVAAGMIAQPGMTPADRVAIAGEIVVESILHFGQGRLKLRLDQRQAELEEQARAARNVERANSATEGGTESPGA